MEQTKTNNHGGARAGAGRKATGRQKPFVSTTISGSPEEIAALKSLATSKGKSLSRLVIETLLAKHLDEK